MLYNAHLWFQLYAETCLVAYNEARNMFMCEILEF